uniref:AP-1 complex subunit gamma-1 n=1 Tax=Lygus hesperus TaxID=30085 RepID=A0A0A9WDW1_LYGHE
MSRFLSSVKDNNLRFVALELFNQYATLYNDTVQEHQTVILSCLKDTDLYIRRRALRLTVRLINADNVRLLVPDLIAYLHVCVDELREEVTRQICDVIETQSPSEE